MDNSGIIGLSIVEKSGLAGLRDAKLARMGSGLRSYYSCESTLSLEV